MIRYDIIDWDDEDDPRGNVRHIADNGVTVDEFESIINGSGPDGTSRSSGRPYKRGETDTGKYLHAVYELDDDGGFVILTPVTAYEVEPP